jgi:hypothetical protein
MTRRAPGAHSSVEPASVGAAMLFGGIIEDGDRYRIDRRGERLADAAFVVEGAAYVIRPASPTAARLLTLGQRTIVR